MLVAACQAALICCASTISVILTRQLGSSLHISTSVIVTVVLEPPLQRFILTMAGVLLCKLLLKLAHQDDTEC